MSTNEYSTSDITLPVELAAPIQSAGKTVITTELLARAYGTNENNIQMNFARNEERFIDGVHFVKLTGSKLKEFKRQPTNSGLVDKFASSLVLWTERGAARHAKLLDTDAAWEIFEKLEDSYFRQPQHLSGGDRPKAITGAVRILSAYTKAARLLGLDANQAAFHANRATQRELGINFIEELGVARLEASGEAAGMNATILAQRTERKNARALNAELFDGGFQKKNEAGEWVLTEKGEQYGREYDVMPAHGKGRSRPQILWTEAIIPVLTGEATH